jgi:hypothetical protein
MVNTISVPGGRGVKRSQRETGLSPPCAAELQNSTYTHTMYLWELRKIFGLKWGEVTGKWRKLHSEELHDQIFFG